MNEWIWIIFYLFVYLYADKFTRSGSKTEQESGQSTRENSQITCFFKACDRDASEKLLNDTYGCKMTSSFLITILIVQINKKMASICFVNLLEMKTNSYFHWLKMDNVIIIVLIIWAMGLFSMRKPIQYSIVNGFFLFE